MLAFLLTATAAGPAHADSTAADEGFADFSLEDLLQVEVTVTSSSRRETPIRQSSVPVSVVTADDIHFGGRTTLAEVLQFVPGVDVLFSDRTRGLVGVRGLHDQFSERTLLLVDGRMGENAVFGGGEYFRVPLILEDIERVEVVRGPGGAAWGANAFNGVINVMTKDPRDTQGVLISSTLTEFGDSYSQLRYGGNTDTEDGEGWAYRISAGYEDVVNSSQATARDNFVARDFRRQVFLGGKATRDYSEDTRLTLDASFGSYEAGVREQLGVAPAEDSTGDIVRVGAKLEQDFSPTTSGYLQWSGVYDSFDLRTFGAIASLTNDVEAQYNFEHSGSHQSSVGGNFRWTHFDADDPDDGFTFGDESFNEFFAGVFFIDRWDITPRTSFEAQVRLDHYSEQNEPVDYSARLTGFYALDDAKQHVLRLSGARAFRTPVSSLRRVQINRFPVPSPPFPPGTTLLNVLPDPELDNESLLSLEAGYSGQFSPQWSGRIDGYVQVIDELIVFQRDLDAFGGTTFTPVNSEGAIASGVELELSWKNEHAQVTGYYGLNNLELDGPRQNIRGYFPARHRAGVNTRVRLFDDVTLNTNYRFTGVTETFDRQIQENDIRPQHIVDLSLSFPVARGGRGQKGELTLGVYDLFDETDITVNAVSDTMFGTQPHPTPGQTFFMRLSFAF